MRARPLPRCVARSAVAATAATAVGLPAGGRERPAPQAQLRGSARAAACAVAGVAALARPRDGRRATPGRRTACRAAEEPATEVRGEQEVPLWDRPVLDPNDVGGPLEPVKQFVRDNPEGAPGLLGAGTVALSTLMATAVLLLARRQTGGPGGPLATAQAARSMVAAGGGDDPQGIRVSVAGVLLLLLALVLLLGLALGSGDAESEGRSLWDRPFLDPNQRGGPLEPVKQFVRENPDWGPQALAVASIISGILGIAAAFRLVRLVVGLPVAS